MGKKILIIVLLFSCVVVLNNDNVSTSIEQSEPSIAAARECGRATVIAEKALNFGSLVGSYRDDRTITVATNGEVTQSARSHVGALNYRNLAQNRISQPGTVKITATELNPGSRMIVEFGVKPLTPGYSFNRMSLGRDTLTGLNYIPLESDIDTLVFNVLTPDATARILYGGTLNIDKGHHGSITSTVPVNVSFKCS